MTQISTKFIQDNAIRGSKIRLLNNEVLRARNAADSADVTLFKLNNGDVLEFLTQPRASASLPIPTNDRDYVTVEYIKNYVQGKLDAKNAVNILADSNINLSGTSTLTIDGYLVLNGWRVALTNQTNPVQNGVYDAAINGANWILTRSADFDQVQDAGGLEVTSGAYFPILAGTVYQGFEVILATPDPISIGSTSLTFLKIPGPQSYTGGDMIIKVGNDFAVDLAPNSGLESTNPGNAGGQLRVKTATGVVEKDRTVQIDASGNVVAKRNKKQNFSLGVQDITNQYVDLADVAAQDSVELTVSGASPQLEGTDYTVNYTGGTGSKTRVSFAGGLANAGVSALAVGDFIVVKYQTF